MDLNEEQIRALVERFYDRVRRDPQLGPIFAQRLEGRWPAHLDKMVRFWSTVLLGRRGYAGNPRATHASIEGLDAGLFTRWLALFDETLGAMFDPAVAADVSARAHAMAEGLQRGLPRGRRSLDLTE